MSRFQLAFGVGGVPPHENARAHRWEHRLRWIMAGVALLAVPAFYLENQIELQELGGLIRAIDVLIVFAFTLELAWMLKLVDQRAVKWQNRAHFFGVAAQAMRRILVDHARARAAGKRGDGAERLSLDEVVMLTEAPHLDVLALDEARTRLAQRRFRARAFGRMH